MAAQPRFIHNRILREKLLYKLKESAWRKVEENVFLWFRKLKISDFQSLSAMAYIMQAKIFFRIFEFLHRIMVKGHLLMLHVHF